MAENTVAFLEFLRMDCMIEDYFTLVIGKDDEVVFDRYVALQEPG